MLKPRIKVSGRQRNWVKYERCRFTHHISSFPFSILIGRFNGS